MVVSDDDDGFELANTALKRQAGVTATAVKKKLQCLGFMVLICAHNLFSMAVF